MGTLILDMGGVIYSFSNVFDADKHDEQFLLGLKRIDNVFKGVSEEYLKIGATKRVLEAEYYLVKNKLINIYPIKAAVKRLNTDYKLDNLVIISTSLIKTSEMICKIVGLKDIPKYIFNMSDYGSKKDKNAWKKIFNTLSTIDVIVEDGSKNLESANSAAQELGFLPLCVKSIIEL